MNKSDIVIFAQGIQKAKWLRAIKRNSNTDVISDWVLEGLQDLGLIDHKNNLTAAGEEMLNQYKDKI